MTKNWLSFVPALDGVGWLTLAIVGVCVVLLVRFFWGKSLSQWRWGLVTLRTIAAGLVILILCGPTRIDQFSVDSRRPEMLFLMDGSASMKLGTDTTRWQDAMQFLRSGMERAGEKETSQCNAYRFGHRLAPLFGNAPPSIAKFPSDADVPPPEASDTRAADAFREIASRVDPTGTAGIVLMSDGRFRSSESVEQLASYLGDRGVPIHVYPVGSLDTSGDVAIVSLVAAASVRKFTENQVQVFLRSFGMAGQRTTVKIFDTDAPVGTTIEVASLPITLTGSTQSATLAYNIADRAKNLRVVIEPVAGELTNRNNELQMGVAIDRTRIRVLYVEGDAASSTSSSFLRILTGQGRASSADSQYPVALALRDDDDIECVIFASDGGQTAPRQIDESGSFTSSQFPATWPELCSYDCLILSNVGPDVFNEGQHAMLLQWIQGRGAGLIVCGVEGIQATRWRDNPLVNCLPIKFDSFTPIVPLSQVMKVDSVEHPVWKLFEESSANTNALKKLPSILVGKSLPKVKSGAEILATVENLKTGSTDPAMVVERFGRGRVLTSGAALAGGGSQPLWDEWDTRGKRNASKLWRNMVFWVTEGSSIGRRRVTLQADKRFYKPGENLTVSAFSYNESGRRTEDYALWAMFEPLSLDDTSMLSPAIWPEGLRRESGETSARIAWGEEIPLQKSGDGSGYSINLNLSETGDSDYRGMRMELTAYERPNNSQDTSSGLAFGHGTQIDSTSLEIYILSDPFEQQNPLPNHELLERISTLSGGKVLTSPAELAELLRSRPQIETPPEQTHQPAWSQWWLLGTILGLVTSEWMLRRFNGLA